MGVVVERDTSAEWCPACREWRPLEAWFGTELRWDPEQAVVCSDCREKGTPPRDPLPALEPKVRQILKDVMLTGSLKEAAKRNDVSASSVGHLLQGRRRPEVRRAFQILLENEGLDLFTLARMAKQLLHSHRAQWNPKAEEWDFFPDNPARLGTLRHLTKLHEVEPPKVLGDKAPTGVTVLVQTNLSEKCSSEAPGTIIAHPGQAASDE